MARVLVVSRNPDLARGLTPTDHEVVAIRPADFDEWFDDGPDDHLEGVVLDLIDADTAVRAITGLRARARMVPVLVVPGDGNGWDDPRMHELPAAAILDRPVTRATLQDAVTRLVDEGSASFLASRVPQIDDEASIAAQLSTPTGLSARHDDVDDGTGTGLPIDDAPDRADRDGRPRPTTVVTGETTALLARLTASPPRIAADDPDDVLVPAAPKGDVAHARTAIDVVRQLDGVAHQLYGLDETAQAVVEDALARVDAAAAALLLPDGPRWRVVAGIGLRPLERRYELTAEDWLVVEVGRTGACLVIDDAEPVRRRLRGSPLATWPHLIAASVPDVDGVLLVARDEPSAGFDASDTERLATLADEAAPLLVAALEVRALARRLEHVR